MADTRCADPEYAEDIDNMILEYLIYSLTSRCIDEFMARNDKHTIQEPSETVLANIDILNGKIVGIASPGWESLLTYLALAFRPGFLARYPERERDKKIGFSLRILNLVLLITYRWADYFAPRSPSPGPTDTRSLPSVDPQVVARRRYWFSVREDQCRVTEQEHGIYNRWADFCARSPTLPGSKLPHPPLTLISAGPLFFAASAQIASFLDRETSEMWVGLAAEFMLQTALDSLMIMPDAMTADIALVTAFAWGWIPPSHWEHYCQSGRDKDGKAEATINKMFKNEHGRGTGELERWQEMRLRYLSMFDVPEPSLSRDDTLAERLRDLAQEYPPLEFEKKVMTFARHMWAMDRKPILVQIEEGKMEDMSDSEFEEFKKRIFPS